MGGADVAKTKATLIYLDNGVVLTKKEYQDWREIQDEYWDHYKANLIPLTCENIIEFFEMDFREEAYWPFSKNDIIQFFEGEAETIYSRE